MQIYTKKEQAEQGNREWAVGGGKKHQQVGSVSRLNNSPMLSGVQEELRQDPTQLSLWPGVVHTFNPSTCKAESGPHSEFYDS